jgi:hypothetical protein
LFFTQVSGIFYEQMKKKVFKIQRLYKLDAISLPSTHFSFILSFCPSANRDISVTREENKGWTARI